MTNLTLLPFTLVAYSCSDHNAPSRQPRVTTSVHHTTGTRLKTTVCIAISARLKRATPTLHLLRIALSFRGRRLFIFKIHMRVQQPNNIIVFEKNVFYLYCIVAQAKSSFSLPFSRSYNYTRLGVHSQDSTILRSYSRRMRYSLNLALHTRWHRINADCFRSSVYLMRSKIITHSVFAHNHHTSSNVNHRTKNFL